MKSLLLIGSLLVSVSTFAAVEPVTCESLQEKANQDCEELMCEEFTLAGEACLHDGDFMEGFQICSYEGFYYELEKFNKENPKSQLVCEDEE